VVGLDNCSCFIVVLAAGIFLGLHYTWSSDLGWDIHACKHCRVDRIASHASSCR